MTPKLLKIIRWILIGILTVQFLAAGVAKLFGGWDSMFQNWGYPTWFALLIGVAEVLAVIGLYFQATRKLASLMIILIMIGAVYTHTTAGEDMKILHNAVLIIFASAILWLNKKVT